MKAVQPVKAVQLVEAVQVEESAEPSSASVRFPSNGFSCDFPSYFRLLSMLSRVPQRLRKSLWINPRKSRFEPLPMGVFSVLHRNLCMFSVTLYISMTYD